jgi:hypothetical protein
MEKLGLYEESIQQGRDKFRADSETLRREGELLLRQADHLFRVANKVTTGDPMENFERPAKIGDYRSMKRPEALRDHMKHVPHRAIASRCLQ